MVENSAQTDATTDHSRSDRTASPPLEWKLRWGSYLLIASALLFIFQGVSVIARALLDTRFEPGVSDLGGVTAHELANSNPAVQSYIDHLAVNVGGLMLVVGIAMIALVWFGVRNRQLWAYTTTIILPVGYLLIGIPIHQTVHFHFDEVAHLGTVGIGIPLLLAGAVLAYLGLRTNEPVSGAEVTDQ